VPLEFRCLDRTPAVLEAGKKFFSALTAQTIAANGNVNGSLGCPWTVRTIRGEIKNNGGLSVEIKGKPAALSAAINVYNELFWNFSPVDTEALFSFTRRQARLLSSVTENSGSILVVEPGIPRSGEFISLLRSNLTEEGRPPLSPCVHSGACPLPGRGVPSRKSGKAKWCHFAFDTDDAPQALHKLSGAAGLPKERAVLSFLLAGPKLPPVKLPTARLPTAKLPTAANPRRTDDGAVKGKTEPRGRVKIRVISDPFPVGNFDTYGRYGCAERGLLLVTGNKTDIENSPSGAFEELPVLDNSKDAKSGALIARKE